MQQKKFDIFEFLEYRFKKIPTGKKDRKIVKRETEELLIILNPFKISKFIYIGSIFQ